MDCIAASYICNALNQNLAKVAKAHGKSICDCIKDFAKAKLTGTIESCLTSDPKGKVAKAKDKTVSDETKKCAASTVDFGATNSTVVNDTAMQKELDFIHDVFGSDLDTAISTEEADKDLSKCQQQVAKAVKKCQDAKLKEFNRHFPDNLQACGNHTPVPSSREQNVLRRHPMT